jgi:LPXTG-site transpeptidase (sortase) family protein
MHRKKPSVLGAVIPLAIVACVSLAIVGGIVIWMAGQEGMGLGDMRTQFFGGQQLARPFPAQSTRLPTPTLLRLLRTPIPTVTATPSPAPVEPAPTLKPSEPPAINEPSPQSAISLATPTLTPTLQIEPNIESPIRPGSPLPERPATRLVIPAIQLDVPVILSPIVSQTWKVDHLGKDFVGHLEGTASPGDPSNVVLAGHVTIAHNVYGPFAGLGQLKPGDPVIVYTGDQPFTYVVDYRQLVERTNVDVTYPTTTGRVTLITCSNWSDELGAYEQRLVVVGHLADRGS